jgi:hypothetical protein
MKAFVHGCAVRFFRAPRNQDVRNVAERQVCVSLLLNDSRSLSVFGSSENLVAVVDAKHHPLNFFVHLYLGAAV